VVTGKKEEVEKGEIRDHGERKHEAGNGKLQESMK